jgi:hypothetical protein
MKRKSKHTCHYPAPHRGAVQTIECTVPGGKATLSLCGHHLAGLAGAALSVVLALPELHTAIEAELQHRGER